VASQAGNVNWNAALDVTNSVTVRDVSSLAAPRNLAASDGTYTNKVAVTWDAASGATGYRIFRHTSNNSASATQIGTAVSTTYDDTAAVAGTTYYYWVKAVNAEGSFSASDSGFVGVVGPLITANGLVGNVDLNSGDPVTIAVQMMNIEPYLGADVDWWVVALAGSSWYYMNDAMQWTQFDGNLSNCHPVYQGGLFDLPATEVLNMTGLPVGSYTFWFAIDYPMDGILDLNGPILYDNVTVVVQ